MRLIGIVIFVTVSSFIKAQNYNIVNELIQENYDTTKEYSYIFCANPMSLSFVKNDPYRQRVFSVLDDLVKSPHILDSLVTMNQLIADTFEWGKDNIGMETKNQRQIDSIRTIYCRLPMRKKGKASQLNETNKKRFVILKVSYPIMIDAQHVLISVSSHVLGSMYYYCEYVYLYKLNDQGVWVTNRMVYSVSG